MKKILPLLMLCFVALCTIPGKAGPPGFNQNDLVVTCDQLCDNTATLQTIEAPVAMEIQLGPNYSIPTAESITVFGYPDLKPSKTSNVNVEPLCGYPLRC